MSTHRRSHHFHQRRGQTRGVSLIELMVAMVIGLIVVGAVFTNYINNAAGTRQTAALTQVTSDASLALGILRNHIAIAGYGAPVKVGTAGLVTDLTGPVIAGCAHGFSKASAGATIDNITCADAPEKDEADPGSSLLVRYETDASVSPTVIPEGGGGEVPADCASFGLKAVAGKFVAENRFRVTPADGGKPPSLACSGNGDEKHAYQPLVDNVTEMRLSYGIAGKDTENSKLLQVKRYLDADKIAAPGTPDWQKQWSDVLTVRICVVVRSTEEVLPQNNHYMNCNQESKLAPDRRIYRAFSSTVLINNRLSGKVFDIK